LGGWLFRLSGRAFDPFASTCCRGGHGGKDRKDGSMTSFTSMKYWFSLTGLFALFSCETLKQSSKYQFTEGYYNVKSGGDRIGKVYALTASDSIKAYRKIDLEREKIDTTKAILIAFPPQKPNGFQPHSFRRTTFDVDVLTVLFKYRPSVKGFPPQFNASFNGAAYFGYRTDTYKLSYSKTPMHVFNRRITHYGYSFGVFTGFGTARIDEYVTNNALSIEYDGLVNLTGVAVILAVDKLSFGITCGEDHLLDKNARLWVNNGMPWLGISLGLNLN
jgi:hypothetical protein